jgi:nucleoside-diphosphate-sugar epimerase
MTKVLVTGASGFIGRNVLLATPPYWDIVATYSASEDFPGFLDRHELTHITPVRCDLADFSAVQRLVGDHGHAFDIGLYLAANVSIPLSVEHPLIDLTANTIALLNTLESIRCGRFVYMSSGAVYDGLAGRVDPTMPLNPRFPYAISKLASEHYVRFFRYRRQKLESFVILRFFGAFGPYEPSRKIYTKLIRALVLEGTTEFKVTGDGRNLIDAMYVDDAVNGILGVLTSEVKDVVVDFASGSSISINGLVERVSSVFEVPVKIVNVGITEEYIEFDVDTEPMADMFGFRPSISLDDGLVRFHKHLVREQDRGS